MDVDELMKTKTAEDLVMKAAEELVKQKLDLPAFYAPIKFKRTDKKRRKRTFSRIGTLIWSVGDFKIERWESSKSSSLRFAKTNPSIESTKKSETNLWTGSTKNSTLWWRRQVKYVNNVKDTPEDVVQSQDTLGDAIESPDTVEDVFQSPNTLGDAIESPHTIDDVFQSPLASPDKLENTIELRAPGESRYEFRTRTCAKSALDLYNKTFDEDFELDRAIISKLCQGSYDFSVWVHINFTAKSKNDPDDASPKLFFAELKWPEVRYCSIVRPRNGPYDLEITHECGFCNPKDELCHPVGEFEHGHWPYREGNSDHSDHSDYYHDRYVKRPNFLLGDGDEHDEVENGEEGDAKELVLEDV